jgi:hypothetical protein
MDQFKRTFNALFESLETEVYSLEKSCQGKIESLEITFPQCRHQMKPKQR